MSTNITIVIHNEDEGPYDITVNGETICSASYDEDGSYSMRKIVQLAKDLGAIFGVEVHQRYSEE